MWEPGLLVPSLLERKAIEWGGFKVTEMPWPEHLEQPLLSFSGLDMSKRCLLGDKGIDITG